MAPNLPFKAYGRRRNDTAESSQRPESSRAASIAPITPQPVDESADTEYFPTLSNAPSAQSRLSAAPPMFLPLSNSGHSRVGGDRGDRPGFDQGRRNSIRIRRSSAASLRSTSNPYLPEDGVAEPHDAPREGGRPRSISQPERARLPDPALARHSRRAPQVAMPRLTEEGGRPSLAELGIREPLPAASDRSVSPFAEGHPVSESGSRTRMQRARKLSRVFWPGASRRQGDKDEKQPFSNPDPDDEYAEELVDWLDMIDPEVQTLSTLTNVQNSLFIPDLGNWVNRRPTYILSQLGPEQEWARGQIQEGKRRDTFREPSVLEDAPPLERTATISSRLTESHYAALPHGASLEGWTDEEKKQLDDHVRHMLHSRRSRMKRSLKGFGQYVRRPLGFFVTLYATLITLFGLAWVLFLIGWIYVGDKQLYVIHVIDSVLVALFAIMGDGLAPFRAVDTYHMIFIARFTRMITRAESGKGMRTKIQKKSITAEERNSIDHQAAGRMSFQQARELMQGPPVARIPTRESAENVDNDNEISEVEQPADLEVAKSTVSGLDMFPLTYKQIKSLQHHQKKFAKSHSFYKPHETFTHHPFPNSYLIAIVILLDCHSLLQISLGACTWGIDYHTRHVAITTVILCVSITCNITAGVLISMGDRKTRKKDVMELLNRQELTSDAMKLVKGKGKKKEKDSDQSSASGSASGSTTREKEDRDSRDAGSNKLQKVPT